MNTQPESLRLADWLQMRHPEQIEYQDLEEAAAELRRLHALNQELLAVLKELEESVAYWSEYDVPLGIADRICAAITKAEAQQ